MLKKILIGVGGMVVLVVAALIAVPFLFKDTINNKIKTEINNQLNAKVDYGSFSLSLIRSFPNFNFSLNDLCVVGVDDFKNDTLVSVKNFGFTLDLMSVIKGDKYKLLALRLSEPQVHAIVNFNGKANWDIVKPSKDKTSDSEKTAFSLEIKKYKIENGQIVYDDRMGNSYARISDLDFEGSGNVSDAVYDFVTKTEINELSYKSGAVPYLNKAKLSAQMNISVDNINNKYTFKENVVSINDLGLQFDGYVQPKKEATALDVKFKASQTEFKNILSLIPGIYQKNFSQIKTSGTLALDGNVKGEMKGESYPAFNLNIKVNNGMFQYPDLPVAVKNIFLAATVAKPQGSLDLSVVDISKLHVEAGADPVDVKINVRTPLSNPNVKANIVGRMNLSNVPKFYPIEGLKTISGLLQLQLDFSGTKNDLDKKNYQTIHAAGNLKIANLVYDTKQTPMPVRVMDMQMVFNPQNVTLNSFSAAIGKSDFYATGTLNNFMAYAFGKGDLEGNLNLRSSQFDANEWLQKNETTKAAQPNDTAKAEYFKVPAHIDFTVNSQIGKIFYEKIVLENAKGQIAIKDEAIHLNNIFANLLGGSATISAVYDTKAKTHPDVTFTYAINNFDFQKTYQAVGMSEKLAPVIKYVQGNFSSNLKGEGKLNQDMSVDYNSLTGDGKVEIPTARLVGLPVLQKVMEVAKIPALQNMELKNAYTVLKFNNGRVNVDPTDFKFGNGYNVNVKGSNGFDQSIDYDMRMDVPTKELGGAGALAQSYLSKIPGLGATVPDLLNFTFKVTGTAAKPQIKLLNVGAGGGSSAKEILTNTVEDLKKKAEEEAKAKVDELKKQAEQQARDAADKAKKEAEQRAREAVDKAKKEAEDKLKDVFKFPR